MREEKHYYIIDQNRRDLSLLYCSKKVSLSL